MPANWSKKMKVMDLQCNACGIYKPEGHLKEDEFLCETCYIEKFLHMEDLKPLPHRSLRTHHAVPEGLQGMENGLNKLKKLWRQFRKWFNHQLRLFHFAG